MKAINHNDQPIKIIQNEPVRNLFTHIRSIPKKVEQPNLELQLLGSVLSNILNDEDLTFEERVNACKLHLAKHGLYKTKQ